VDESKKQKELSIMNKSDTESKAGGIHLTDNLDRKFTEASITDHRPTVADSHSNVLTETQTNSGPNQDKNSEFGANKSASVKQLTASKLQ